jgi:hypothetical protein
MISANPSSEQANGPTPREIAKAFSSLGASKGGKARARALTPEQRSEIAREAVEARWAKHGKSPLPRVTHPGTLRIGDLEIECAVLEDGTRVISQRGFANAVGAAKPSSMTRRGDGELPAFLTAGNLKPFIDKELTAAASPVVYAPLHGGRTAYGIKAEAVPKICKIWLLARDAGALKPNQMHLATGADVIIRGLAEVGIVALVDEATGYQDLRPRDALARILEAYIAKELRSYVRTFPLNFFKQLCRLKGIPFHENMQLPRYFGHIINDLVWDRIAPCVKEELRRKNPIQDNGRRKRKHHQWLTESIGHPKLLHHLGILEGLAAGHPNGGYDAFYQQVNDALPSYTKAPLWAYLKDEQEGE